MSINRRQRQLRDAERQAGMRLTNCRQYLGTNCEEYRKAQIDYRRALRALCAYLDMLAIFKRKEN